MLSPTGTVEHAVGVARDRRVRDALARSTRAIDRARTRSVRPTFAALEMWRALHAGRWSLIETFERDGRRYYVAQPNVPGTAIAASAPSLTARESQVLDQLALGHGNKLIAYSLGISPSTVATLLGRAARKLGAADTQSLLAIARARLDATSGDEGPPRK